MQSIQKMKASALWQVAWSNRALVLVYVIIGIVCAFLSSYGATYLQRVLDSFQRGDLTPALLLGYGGILLFLCILEYLDNAPDVRLPNRIALGLKLKALGKIAIVDYRSQQTLGTGMLIQRIENGADAGKRIVYDFYLRIARELIPAIFFSVFFIARIELSIVGYVAIGYVAVFAISKWLLGRLYQLKERILDNEEHFQHTLVRGLMSLAVFRIHKRYARDIERAEAAADTITATRVQIRLIHEAFFALFYVLVIIVKVALIWIGWRGGTMTVGAVVAILALLDRAYQPIAIANVLFVQYKLDCAAYARFKGFLELPDDQRLLEGETLSSAPACVDMQHVTVRYGDRTVLDDFSLTLRPGKTIALVGESGGGKSTIAKLIAGLLQPDDGRILIDSQDMATISLMDYYGHLAYIPQDPPIFHGSLRENLAFDAPLPDAALHEALDEVALGTLLAQLPEGLETQVGEHGRTLSGGERQRLALARLLCTQPRIVVLDEATSALDSINEQAILQRLKPFFASRMVCIVAHRLHAIAGVDEILVMQAGRLAERGTFDDLIKRGGEFTRLWEAAQIDDR